MSDMSDRPEDDFEDFPPGRPLPDHLPEEVRKMLEAAQERGTTVRLGRQVLRGDGFTGELVLSRGFRSLYDHPADCACVFCSLNEKIDRLAKSELSFTDKLEGAQRLMTEEAHRLADMDRQASTKLIANAAQLAAHKKNREWLLGALAKRLEELMDDAHWKDTIAGYDENKDEMPVFMAKAILVGDLKNLHSRLENATDVTLNGLYADPMDDVTTPMQLMKRVIGLDEDES